MPRDNFRDQDQMEDKFDLDTRSGENEPTEQNERWDFFRTDKSGNWNCHSSSSSSSSSCSSSSSSSSSCSSRSHSSRSHSSSSSSDLCDFLFSVDLITVPQNCQIRFLHFIECLAKFLREEFCEVFVGLQVYRINCRQFVVIYQFENTSDVFCKLEEINCRIRKAFERNFGNNIRRCTFLSLLDAELVFCSEE